MCATLTGSDDLVDGHARVVRHEAEHGEDDKAGEEARQRVDERHRHRHAVAVVVERVVRRHRDEAAVRHAQRVEDLRARLAPHLRQHNSITVSALTSARVTDAHPSNDLRHIECGGESKHKTCQTDHD